jgi:hypothetical protein
MKRQLDSRRNKRQRIPKKEKMIYHPYKYLVIKAVPVIIILALVAFFYFFWVHNFFGMFSGKQSESPRTEQQMKDVVKLSVEDEKRFQEQASEIIKNANFEECQKIENEMYKNVCRNNIIMNKARQENDVSLCVKLDNKLMSIENCERQIAMQSSIQKEDVSICLKASIVKIQKECQINYWNNMSFEKNDIKLCDNLNDNQDQKNCRDTFIFVRDFKTNSRNFDCQKFNDYPLQSDCQKYKSNLMAKKDNPCENIDSPLFSTVCQKNEMLP